MADFNPDEYIAQKSGGFNPDEYIAQKGKVTVEAAPDQEEEAPTSSLPKLGTLKDAAKSAERMAIGFAKPPAAIAEMLGFGEPAKQLLARDAELKEQTGLGGSLSSIAGDVMGYLLPAKGVQAVGQTLKAIPKVAELAGKVPAALESIPALSRIAKDPLAQLSATGAAGSLLNPIGKTPGEEGYAEERKNQALVAAAAGPIIGSVAQGVGRVMDPQLKRLAELKAQGIDINSLIKGDSTLGQILGGGTQAIENFLKVFPFAGLKKAGEKGNINLKNLTTARNDITKQTSQEATDDISKAIEQDILKSQQETGFKNAALDLGHKNKIKTENQQLADEVAGYSNPVIEDALAAANLKLTKGKVGNAAVDEANTKISAGYEKFHNEVVNVPFLKTQKDDISSFLDPKNLKQFDLTPDFKARLENDVADLVSAAGSGRKLSTRVWQAKMQKLGDKAYSLRNETENKFEKAEYANALNELKDKWMKMVEDSTKRTDIRQLNQAHSLMQAPSRASSHLKTMLEKEGDFDPQTLIAQLKNDMPQKRFASLSDARVKDAIEKYQDVAKRKADLKLAQEQRKFDLEAVKGTNQKAHDEFVSQLKDVKTKATRNVEQEAGKRQDKLNELIAGTQKESLPSGILNKLGYVLAAAPAARLVTGAGGFMGVPGAGLAASALNPFAIGAAALGPLTRLGYTSQQQAIKNLATVPRSEMMKAGAANIRQNLPTIGGLGGYTTATTPLPQQLEEE